MGAGVQRWWRDPGRFARECEIWRSQRTGELHRMIVGATARTLPLVRASAIAWQKLGEEIGNHERPMTSSTMEELLAECSEPLTEVEYRARREQLLLAFQEKHNLYTWGAIEKAIRTHAIDESMLVEQFIELRASHDRRRDRPDAAARPSVGDRVAEARRGDRKS